MKSDELYLMRDEKYTNGLIDLINYINTYSNTKEMNMIEIGAYAGESTIIFSKYFKSVITIDPFINNYDINDPACQYADFENVFQKFKENTKSIDNIFLIRKTSNMAFRKLKKNQYDFIYIDGLHTYKQVKKDIENYIQLIKKEGFIGGHDYHENWQPVINAIHQTIGEPNKIFNDTSWIKLI